VLRKWSQEEFAHVSGLHRTYIGQIERGEKNISFGNLVKVAGVLGVTLSELLTGLEDNRLPAKESAKPGDSSALRSNIRMLDIQKLLKRLSFQKKAMDRTMELLEQLAVSGRPDTAPSGKRLAARRSATKKRPGP
jgi:transcriptional regulator with XRE-family HTH domain